MDDHDQLAALYQEQERAYEDLAERIGRGMTDKDDEALFRCAVNLPRKRTPHKETHDGR